MEGQRTDKFIQNQIWKCSGLLNIILVKYYPRLDIERQRTVKYYPISQRTQILSKITEDCHILSNITEDCQMFFNIGKDCQMLSKIRWKGNFDFYYGNVEDCQILSKIAEDCQILSKIRYGRQS